MKFRKRPVVVEAIQYKPHDNCAEIAAFLGLPHAAAACQLENRNLPFVIHTLEGDMEASPGDWIIKGVKGEFYPCKPDIFEQTYMPADASPEYVPSETARPEVERKMEPWMLEKVAEWLEKRGSYFDDYQNSYAPTVLRDWAASLK